LIVERRNMLPLLRQLRRTGWAALGSLAAPFALCGQAAPLPDVPTLLAQVLQHQRQMESVQENYTFRELDVTDTLNKDGSVKKTESEDDEIFFVNSHEVRRQVKKDGKDLTPDQQQKEQERVMKYVEKAEKTPPGQAPNGEVVLSVSRILAVVKVSSPRRETLDGRSTIAFDFTGDPHAKAHGPAEEAARRMSGTVWIDEQDRQVRRLKAQVDDNVHVGLGMVSINRGSTLIFDQKLVNNELWLPTSAELHVNARAFAVVGVRANIHVTDRDYEKFHAEAQQQAGATVVPGAPPVKH
jgi:hypothetical protein